MLFWVAWVWGTASGSDGGFEPVRAASGCAISMRPGSHVDGAAMRAECDWPDVQPDVLARMLERYERYPEYVYPIDVARIERIEVDRTLVYQRQVIFGIAAREVLLWIQREPLPGGVRFAWTTASEEPLILTRGAVRAPRNEGSWSVTQRDGGGSKVVHEIAMDAGGAVPRWLIELVRTRAFARIMTEVHALGAARSLEPGR
ncbi:MAG TPA: hypothetical protein ENK18_16855 [Deltaproteobacteria bacterium]|nr:hypothetical protein [Deltaproteobacteria bacterium]